MGRASEAKQKLTEAVRELIWAGSYGSTTIDQICEKAGVNKGSFYHFFTAKADVAATAIEAGWERARGELDSIFSPTVPPIDRLRHYCAYSFRFQSEIKAKYGCVLGCPLFSLGAEISTQEDRLQKKIQDILHQKQKYLESAIRDAHAAGQLHAPDAAAKARMLYAYYQGLLTEARIQNDLSVLREAERGTEALLGVKKTRPVAA